MTIGIFGGTFNPVHWGHVRTALEIKNTLGLERMLMVPCGIPPHREQPGVSSDDRLAMLKLVVNDFPELEIDERELKRNGPSYSVDTLQSLHDEMPGQSLAMCIGIDAFLQLNTWHRWQDLFGLAHIVVAHRPGWSMENITDQLSVELQKQLKQRYLADAAELTGKSAGIIVELKVTEIDISSSNIRQRINNNESISGLVPTTVEAYIKKHGLYRG
jgi:nicotinate-nucleotide adenylyltransferase